MSHDDLAFMRLQRSLFGVKPSSVLEDVICPCSSCEHARDEFREDQS